MKATGKICCIMLVSITMFCTQGLRAQLNPVDTLFYEQSYAFGNYCPSYNCFNLYWPEPAAGNDTLIGYKIFRDGEFYCFTSNTGIGCYEFMPCDYNDFYETFPFWITVKAVYNSDSVLSIAIDSVNVNDLAVSAGKRPPDHISLQENPIHQGDNIIVNLWGADAQECLAGLWSADGKLISRTELIIQDEMVAIDTKSLSGGMYVLSLIVNSKEFTVKVFIE